MKNKGIIVLVLCLIMLNGCTTNTRPTTTATTTTAIQATSKQTTAIMTETTTNTTTTSQPTPEPIPVTLFYDGEGDDIVDFDFPYGTFIFYIEGNRETRHFAITGYDSNGKRTGLFVNTTDSYKGISIDSSQETTILEIKATGNWTVEVRSIYTARTISQGVLVEGVGDEILFVLSSGTKATIKGNDEKRHFAVKSYGTSRDNLMVNTTDKYEGTIILKGEPLILEIIATGCWSIAFE